MRPPASVPVEVELKLGLSASAVPRLLRHPALAAARAGRGKRARLVATYYDTLDCRLADAGIALRLRHDGRGWVQTVKGPALPSSSGALVARGEFEVAVAGPELDRQALAETPWSRTLLRALADPAFGPRFVADVERRTIPLRFDDGTTALLCIDLGELRDQDGERRRPIAELELEQAAAGAPIELFRFAATLAADLPLRIVMASKAARGFALIRNAPDGWSQPVRAVPPSFAGDTPTAAALGAIIRECVGQIAANASGLVADDDPEWVHQMRVGTRRLRSCLGLLHPLLPAPGVSALAAELQWLAGALGACRDRDVFVDLLLPLCGAVASAAGATPLHASLQALLAATEGSRRDAREAARAAVDSARFTRLVLAVGALGSAHRFGVAQIASGDDPLAEPIATFATRLLDRRLRRLKRRSAALATGSDDERHALRIAAKKMRYAAEFFAPAYGQAKHARRFAARLAELQDVLGQWNDAVTARTLVRELAEGLAAPGPAPDQQRIAAPELAAAAVTGWIAARRIAIDAGLAKVGKDYFQARRFWRDA